MANLHGRPRRIYVGPLRNICADQDYHRSYRGWRRCHAQMVWQAMQAIALVACAWSEGTFETEHELNCLGFCKDKLYG